MPIEVVRSIPHDAWDQCVEDSPSSNIFHTREFIDCLAASPKYVPHTFFLLEDGRPIACLIAVQTKVLASFPRFSSRSVVLGGIACARGVSERFLNKHIGELMQAYDESMSTQTLFTEIRNLTDQTSRIIALTRRGYKFRPHLNYLVDLRQGESAIWEGFSGDHRRMLKRAEKAGLETFDLSEPAQIDTFHKLVSRVYYEAHVPVLAKAVFQEAWLRLAPLGRLRITFAKHDGQLVAARAALLYRGRVFDWFAGSSPEGDKLNANALLVWEMIGWGCRNGFETFDFGGAGDPNVEYGVRDFKSRFQGQLVNFGRFVKIYSAARFRVGEAAYGLLRRVLF